MCNYESSVFQIPYVSYANVWLNTKRDMQELETLQIDSEDFGDILGKLEESFKFEFHESEIENLITIEQLADKVISRLDFQEGKECTSQIVFYKLRKHLIDKLKITEQELLPKTRLRDLFQRKGRRQLWDNVFADFYVKIPKLTPPGYLILTLILSFIASVIVMFSSNFIVGLVLFATSWIGWKLSNRYGKSFPVNDLGELAEKLSSENYIDSRKHKQTINIPEIKRLVYEMIADWQSEENKKIISMNTQLDYVG